MPALFALLSSILNEEAFDLRFHRIEADLLEIDLVGDLRVG